MVHLHLHTSGSTLDGAINIDKLMDKVIEQGEKAVAITDHASMVKTYEFYKKAKDKGLKPLIGCEFYCGEADDTNNYHIVLIAKDNNGLKNLFKLTRKSYDLFYKKPRVSMRDISAHRDGLVCLSACVGGEVAKEYFRDRAEAVRTIDMFTELFGQDYYLELQPNYFDEQIEYNKWLVDIAVAKNIRTVVTCDAHYLNKEDYESHDTLICMQVNKKKDDKDRFKFRTKDSYLKTDEEIYQDLNYLPKEIVKICINNTRLIADSCNVSIEYQDLMPSLPGISDPNLELARLCTIGFNERRFEGAFKGMNIKDVVERIYYELGVLKEKGYSGYFLILKDFYDYCKANGIYTGVGRGSCAGCEIAYLLGLTEVEPIRYGLLFERFLNPSRNSPPDFDADICYEDRHKVIEYIKQRYGEDNTAHIIAEGSLTTKAVIRRVLSAYGYEVPVINSYTKLVDDSKSLKENIEGNDELKVVITGQIKKDIENLEGLMSHASKHAAGILIMNDRVDNHFPVRVDRDENVMVCEWHKKHVESLGAYKFDLLGLKQLTIFRKTLEAIEKNYGKKITPKELYNINVEDRGIYRVLNSGKLQSIFQMTGASASAIVAQVKPKCFEDIMVAESICRPGVKEADLYLQNKKDYDQIGEFNKPKYWEYVKDILEPTYGALVYQEQTMLIMNKIAGWDLGKADRMRKVKNLEEYRDDFVNCSIDRGYSSSIANEIFDRFDLGYSFNKSHACAYGKITAICCWLYNYYPKEFLAASMTLELTQAEPQIEAFLREARGLGINILPANINVSTDEFVALKEGITIPLTSIKTVGDSAYKAITEERVEPFESFEEFVSRVPKAKVKKNVVINLIKAGAFDWYNKNRSSLLVDYYTLRGENADNVFFYCDEVQLMYEKQVYGYYITKHPLDGYDNKHIADFEDGKTVSINGIISKSITRKDKRGDMMCFIDLDNKSCSFRGVAFSRAYKKNGAHMREGMRVNIVGKKDGSSVIIDNVSKI